MTMKGKTCIVTGASRGIGKAIALRFAEAGAAVAAAATNDTLLRELCAAIESKGGKALPIVLDVAQLSSVEKAFDEIHAKLGSIDVLVNNAGVTRDNIILRMKEDEWDKVLQVNLKGCFNCTKAATKFMLKQRSGRIINISSISGIVGTAGQANYSAAKAGVIALTKTTAREYASRGILVNAIAPGFINTDMTASIDEGMKAKYLEGIPLKRFGEPADIAGVALFLAGEQAGYITGQTIVVDGGMVML